MRGRHGDCLHETGVRTVGLRFPTTHRRHCDLPAQPRGGAFSPRKSPWDCSRPLLTARVFPIIKENSTLAARGDLTVVWTTGFGGLKERMVPGASHPVT